MKILIGITFLAAIMTGCGQAGNNTSANTAKANNSNTANVAKVSDTTADSDVPRDTTPLSLNVFDMVNGSGEKEYEGRMATVTGGLLDKISYDSLLIRQPGGAGFYCYGEFSDYTKMADKIESLSAQGKSPRVTVKGIYKIASIGTGVELSPCFLTDLDK